MKISGIIGWLKAGLKSPPSHGSGNATAEIVRRFVSPCSACQKERVGSGDGHEFALVASQIALEGSQGLRRFFQLYKSHNWVELNQIQNFDGTLNAALVYVVQCTGGVTIMAVRSPFELYEADSVLDYAVLDEIEAAKIRSLPIEFKSV